MLLRLIFVVGTLGYSVKSEGILMVSTCQSAIGEGRCVASPECCKMVGGSIVDSFVEKPCGSKEVCCYIVPTVPETDQSCGTCSSLTTFIATTTTTTEIPQTQTPVDVQLPSSDDKVNQIQVLPLEAALRDDDSQLGQSPSALLPRFFARSNDLSFGMAPLRIERNLFVKDAIKNMYCWQVALVDSSGKVFGGGALISKNYILTAAHKVANKSPQSFQVVLGKYDFKDQEEDSRIASPLEIIIHEKWDSMAFEYNVALIRIPNVKCTSGQICTICPSTNGVDVNIQGQDICFVTGWGSTYSKGDIGKLQQNQVRAITNNDCLAGLSRAGIQGFTVPKTMFCASSNDPDKLACDGDGGGPMVCMQSGTWVWELRGLVALGVSQCNNVSDTPTVYIDVGVTNSWIKNKISAPLSDSMPWLATTKQTTTTRATRTATTTTTTRKTSKKPFVMNRRSNDESISFSQVFPSFLRLLDGNN